MTTDTGSHLVDEARRNGAQPVTDVNDFLMGGGGQPFKFTNIGDGVKGSIVHKEVRQQTDINTGEPLFWNDGNPRNQLILTLQTELRDDDEDDGLRRIYVKSQMQKALQSAVRAAKERGIADGGVVAVQYVSDGEAQKRGFNPPKEYQVWYWAPPEGFMPVEEFAEPEESFNEQMADVSPDNLPF